MFWLFLGSLLLVWLLYDLMIGRVYLLRAFYFNAEPVGFVLVIFLWLLVAVSCLVWPLI